MDNERENMKIMIETSARHVHLCQKDLAALFGANYRLHKRKDLSQPGQFACLENVIIKGSKGEVKATILGPLRPKTQVEISLTDARKIGLSPPIKESGHLNNAAECTLVGPNGEVALKNCAIIAKRHIHLDPATADKYKLKDNDTVNVKVNSADRTLIFGDVVVRVSDTFSPAMHIDTDEANAAGVDGLTFGEIIECIC